MHPARTDPTAATYLFPGLARSELLVGAPTIELRADVSGRDASIAVRLWDVAPDGKAQGLVTRGVYRVAGAGGSGRRIRFQIAPNAYRFAKGHRIKVEVTGNDSPYLLANHQQSTITIHRLTLSLPVPHDPNRFGIDEVRSAKKRAAVGIVTGIVAFAVLGFLVAIWWFRPRAPKA